MVPFPMTLNWPLNQISRSHYYLTLNISETVRHTQLQRNTNRNLQLHMPYSRVSFWMTWNVLKWLSDIFNDVKHRAVSLRQLSFLCVTAASPSQVHRVGIKDGSALWLLYSCYPRLVKSCRRKPHCAATSATGNRDALSWDLFCSIQKIEMFIRCR